jgi:cholesterol oxidase
MAVQDVIIIGSGFGGSVMACRLAESERYERGDFPRSPSDLDRMTWDPAGGSHGLFDVQRFRRAKMDVVTASGLGGGSLIYSNVLYRMPRELFAGWPGLDRARLDPYYDRVEGTLEARPYPLHDTAGPYALTPKSRLLARAADVMSRDGAGEVAVRLERPALAVTFGAQRGAERRNRHGALQTACSMCGACNLGCNTHSKNSLDLTYLRRAEAHGAEIHTGADVRAILPRREGGYTVVWTDPRDPGSQHSAHCDRVIVAAGSLGSTRLLLQQRRLGHLPHLSAQLGRRWSPNGDLLAVYMTDDHPVDPSLGPVITGALRFMFGGYPDGTPHEVYVEDGGFPDFLAWFFAAQMGRFAPPQRKLARLAGHLADLVLRRRSLTRTAMDGAAADGRLVRNALPLLAMGNDRSTGALSLDRRDRLDLAWSARDDSLHFQRAREALMRVGRAIGAGTLVENPFSLLSRHVTVHPLGGCPMGQSPADGVVDARTGEAFGHPGLYVVDGSIVPTAIGPNPSLTIAALAELYSEVFV